MLKQTIFCVDDENDNLDALERIFRAKYKVLRALSGAEALQILDQYPDPIAVIITDQRMPQMTGVEFLEKSLAKRPDSIRILLTGYTDMESIIAAVNTGQIYRYINKPWDPLDLLNTVNRAVERFNMAREIVQKNQELAKALDELKVLDQAKSQFMILINHELKTPLTGLLSFTELLRETTLNGDQATYLSRIEKSGQRLRELIDDVLLIVSAEMKTLKMTISPFEATKLKVFMKPEVEKMAERKGMKATVALAAKKIVGDEALISQVLARLVHNAVKFGLQGGTISVSSELVKPHRLRLRVFNQGSSIPENVREKVLRPFFIDEDVMSHSSGTGLGLTVCQSILKAHSSRLELSNRDQGVEAAFELPVL
ncbi:MAG: hybrid sensor histidine kinase/response regulator [Bdellovibrio sp.]|nr:MAG: hybrid sensor histidine kinase/response regulator [Bdellovibrio sp.]